MRRWLWMAVVAAGAIVLAAGSQPWIDAIGGAFVPPDIAQDVAAARLFAAGESPYGPAIREMHSRVVPVPVDETFPYFPHPPFSLVISWFSAYVSFPTAALIWFSFSVALLFVLAGLLAESLPAALRGKERRALFPVLVCFGLLLCWPPVLYNLEKGQWSILLAVLTGLGWRSVSRGSMGAGGAWLGLAAAVKVFPVLLGGYLLCRSRRGLVTFVAVGAVATALPLLVIGADAFPSFIRHSRANMPHWETFPSVTLSLHGAVARMFIGGKWAIPAVHAPNLALAVEAVAVAVLLGLATWTTIRARRGEAPQPLAFGAWIALLPLMNPQSLGHNGVLLALPLVLTLAEVSRDERRSTRLAWSLALVLVSIPRQLVWRLAPPPLDPWQGLGLVALPMWGALLLFGLCVLLGRRPVEEAGRP